MSEKNACFHDALIRNYQDERFRAAFRKYFAELGITVRDWDGLFAEMNDGKNAAFVRTDDSGEVAGFIQFTPIDFTSWFFEEACAFIREFWVAEPFRGRGHGSELLSLAEAEFRTEGLFTVVLTTDTAPGFYEAHGFRRLRAMRAKNNDEVFIKHLD